MCLYNIGVKAFVVLLIVFRCNELIETADVASFYSPIRLRVQLLFETNVSDSPTQRLNVTIQRSLAVISKLVAVIPVKENSFLLKRHNACSKFWTNGPNKKKFCHNSRCSAHNLDYDGEHCPNVPSFKINNEHLENVDIYGNLNVTLMSQSTLSGKGAMDADYMIYFRISSDSTSNCEGTLAYSAVCLLGENDRPIAGLVTFCPRFFDYLSKSQLSELLIIHELVHILGFSESLFSNYKDCQLLKDKLECYDRKNTVITDENGAKFLSLPTVKQKLQMVGHCGNVNCSQLKGGPLDKNSASHWDNTLLPNTLMVPKLIETNKTTLDEISFAVLQDTGWYRINFTLLKESNMKVLMKEIHETYPFTVVSASPNCVLLQQSNILFLSPIIIVLFNWRS